MARRNAHRSSGAVWRLAARQHEVVTHQQLLTAGLTRSAIAERVARGRLFVKHRGVYAVGRPSLSRDGERLAAVIASPGEAGLSHWSGAAHWGMSNRERAIEVSVARGRSARQPTIWVHRRVPEVMDRVVVHRGVPVTSPAQTLVDIASRLSWSQLEAVINDADRLELIDPASLREEVGTYGRLPGVTRIKRVLDRHTFVATDSELERMLLPIARRAGLPVPLTQVWLNGFRVDFYWPDLRLVVETDGLRYHRTPAQQARDRLRDNTHLATGDHTVRFTHFQVCHEPAYVESTLKRVARIRRAGGSGISPSHSRE